MEETPISRLVIPKEFKTVINPLSGYINSKSQFYGKTARGLFMYPSNIQYLQTETESMLTFAPYVSAVLEKTDTPAGKTTVSRLVDGFKQYDYRVFTMIQQAIPKYKFPYAEESLIKNPVMQLHKINRDFILDFSKDLILSPTCVIYDFNDYDPDTGTRDDVEWDYGASAYSDGTWHPEQLFSNSKNNKKEGYWVPGDVLFDTDPPGQPFHPRDNYYGLKSRHERTLYSGSGRGAPGSYKAGGVLKDLKSEVGSPGPGAGNKYKYDTYSARGFKTSNGLFPRWQHPSQGVKLYQKNIDEGLLGGGRDDRRVQFTRKYNLSHLIEKSTY
jgi:hypothetical protein